LPTGIFGKPLVASLVAAFAFLSLAAETGPILDFFAFFFTVAFAFGLAGTGLNFTGAFFFAVAFFECIGFAALAMGLPAEALDFVPTLVVRVLVVVEAAPADRFLGFALLPFCRFCRDWAFFIMAVYSFYLV